MKLFLFILLALFWGGSFVAIKVVVAIVPPFWAAATRLISALVIIYLALKVAKTDLGVKPNLRNKVWLSGLFSQGIPFAFLFWGERVISPGLSGILNGTTPLFTFLFGLLLLRQHEPFTIKKLLGLILGIAGIFCIFGPRLSGGIDNSSALATLAVSAMAVSYGLGTIINKSVMVHPDHPSLNVSLFHQTFVSTIFVTLIALAFEGLPHLVWYKNTNFILATLYMGWISTALAFFIYYKLLHEWGALRASAVAYLLPISAVFLDYVINRNIPLTTDAIGAVIILTGMLLLQGRV
jgi:drug/metabolite transporter (DMT)-like permease